MQETMPGPTRTETRYIRQTNRDFGELETFLREALSFCSSFNPELEAILSGILGLERASNSLSESPQSPPSDAIFYLHRMFHYAVNETPDPFRHDLLIECIRSIRERLDVLH
jgi:hypothetical protein